MVSKKATKIIKKNYGLKKGVIKGVSKGVIFRKGCHFFKLKNL